MVGTSGFSYKDWKGSFYPEWLPSKDWFHFYASQFDAVEINLTFYRPVGEKTLLRWKQSAPEGFRIVLKASQTITHRKRLEDCGDEMRAMADEFAPLGDRLACVLFQLPPSLRRDDSKLEGFLGLARESVGRLPACTGYAMEFRHASWNVPDTLDRLSECGWGMVLHDMVSAGGWNIRDRHIRSGGWSLTHGELLDRHIRLLYLRFHGTDGKYAGEYGEAGLRPWADLASAASNRGVPIHAYFNNTIGGGAPRDAQRFRAILGGE